MAIETPANPQQIQQLLNQMEENINTRTPSNDTIERADLLTDDAEKVIR